MSTENTEIVATTEDDLDAFSNDFFGQKEVDKEPASSEAEDKTEEVEDATKEDTQTDEEDTLDTEDEVTEEAETDAEADVEEDKPQPKKNRFQERIDELTAKAKEAERRERALQERLEAIEKSADKNEKTEPANENSGPSAEDKNEDGTDKYPLGEFDPNYIRDLTKYTLQQERELMKAEEEKANQQKQYEAERDALNKSWSEKLGPAQERYPDFQEKGEELYDTFSGINQQYGEYLTATIMSMDFGPDVLYYLANNLDEANKIVAAGPTKATIALGRLEAKFADAEVEKNKKRPKVSKAPEVAPQLKGTNAVVADIPDDTDDLDAFSKKLFKKK